jgi:hypothetical protein
VGGRALPTDRRDTIRRVAGIIPTAADRRIFPSRFADPFVGEGVIRFDPFGAHEPLGEVLVPREEPFTDLLDDGARLTGDALRSNDAFRTAEPDQALRELLEALARRRADRELLAYVLFDPRAELIPR